MLNLATLQFQSSSLERIVAYNAILPVEYEPPYSVLVLLHGYTGNHNDWLYFSRLIEYAQPYPIIIVLPAGENGFYVNLSGPPIGASLPGLQRFDDLIIKDIWQHVHNTFQIRPGRWAIGGLSMGGYGAMRLGLKYPDRFASIWAHSGVYHSREKLSEKGFFDPIEADASTWATHLVKSHQANKLTISFDCGVDDDLIESNRHLHQHMGKIGLPHAYAENPGGHDWDYWNTHLPEALKQHARILEREAN